MFAARAGTSTMCRARQLLTCEAPLLRTSASVREATASRSDSASCSTASMAGGTAWAIVVERSVKRASACSCGSGLLS